MVALPEHTRHVLVVTGRAADAALLRNALLDRAARGPAVFTLLVPAEDDDHEARRRLLDAVELLRASGLDVAGRLGPADPDAAVAETWDPLEYDEVAHVAAEPHGG